jgi:hypothetical protein
LLSDGKHGDYESKRTPAKPGATPFGVGLISVVSAVAGGLTVAWWYRRTLSRLQNPIGSPSVPKSESEDGEENL